MYDEDRMEEMGQDQYLQHQDQKEQEIRHAHARIADLEARLAEAEAVVEKIPKTADGVRIVPGMALYEHVFDGANGLVIGMSWAIVTEDDEPHDPERQRAIGQSFYSTREAAEAARNKEDQK